MPCEVMASALARVDEDAARQPMTVAASAGEMDPVPAGRRESIDGMAHVAWWTLGAYIRGQLLVALFDAFALHPLVIILGVSSGGLLSGILGAFSPSRSQRSPPASWIACEGGTRRPVLTKGDDEGRLGKPRLPKQTARYAE